MNVLMLVETILAVAIPDALVIALYTSMGLGPATYSFVASSTMNFAANVLAFLFACWLACLFIFDAYDLPRTMQAVLGIVTIALALGAATLKGIAYPWAVGVLALLLAICVLGFIRVAQFHSKIQDGGRLFYRSSMISFFLCGFTVMFAWAFWMSSTGRTWSGETKAWLAHENKDVYTYLGSRVGSNFTLNYDEHCASGASLVSYTETVASEITSACKKAKTVWFLQWSGPFVFFMCNCALGLFCSVFSGARSSVTHEHRTAESEVVEVPVHQISSDASLQVYDGTEVVTEAQVVEKPCVSLFDDDGANEITRTLVLLQRFLLILAMSLACMYASLYVSGAAVNLASALLCVGALSVALLLCWMYIEIDHAVLKDAALSQPFAQNLIKATKSDWVRAMTIGGLHIFIPVMACLDILRNKVRICRGAKANQGDKFTPMGRKVANELYTWNWCSILGKFILLAEVLVALIVGSKFTFLFFSWLNGILASSGLNFAAVSVMVFVAGLGMFLCPVVPGSAVYLFAGVVLGYQGQETSGLGFFVGTLVACVLGAVAKMLACCGQYLLGYWAGKSVKVQQWLGVDKVPTRALEKVLKEKGMKLGKVCVLVAGPDFPTSMMCGILKLNIPQMLLGTSPVILVSIVPQTLVGALLAKEGGTVGVWSMISTGATGVAAAFQASATFIYMYCTLKTIERDGEELSQPRKEHEAVAALTRKEEAYVNAFQAVVDWTTIAPTLKWLLLAATCSFMAAGLMTSADFVVTEKFCFQSFSVLDKIEDPSSKGGLDGNALNIVRPLGWLAIFFVFSGVAFKYCFDKAAAARARRRLAEQDSPTVSSTTMGNPRM